LQAIKKSAKLHLSHTMYAICNMAICHMPVLYQNGEPFK